MTRLSVIIVNYNVKEFLEQCLTSLKGALKDITHEIIVVDNASSDGSCRMVKKRFPEIILIENNNNLGFSRANNIALRQAKGEFISLLNPDTIVQEDTFTKLLEGFERFPEAGMMGGKVLNPDGSLQLSCRRSFPTPWNAFSKIIGLSRLFPTSRIFGKYNLTFLDHDEINEVDAISGSFMCVRAKVLENAGYLDEDFFMYGEDLEWCYQIKDSGWKIYYYPESSIVHYKGESSRKSEWNSLKLFYSAMEIFAEKHFRAYHSFTPFWFLKVAIWLNALLSFGIKFTKAMIVPFTDFLFVNLSIMIAIYIRFGGLIQLPLFGDYRDYILLQTGSGFIVLVVMFFSGVYPYRQFSVKRSFYGAFWGSLIIALLVFFSRNLAFSRIVILLSGILNMLLLCGWRIILKVILHTPIFRNTKILSSIKRTSRAVIIGADDISLDMYKKFVSLLKGRMEFAGCIRLDEEEEPGDPAIPILGGFKEIGRIVKEEGISEIVFSSESHSYKKIIDTIVQCRGTGVNFKIVPSGHDLLIGKSSIIPISDYTFLDIEYKYLEKSNKFLKRVMDLSISGMILLPCLPIYLVTKTLKRLNVKHNMYYGENGRPVYIGALLKNDNSYLGFMKNFPLWIHVWKGELSIVGKDLLTEQEEKSQFASFLKPGIIPISKLSYHGKGMDDITFGLHYLKNYSILYDLKIALHYIKSKAGIWKLN